jgi:hypothetical protein
MTVRHQSLTPTGHTIDVSRPPEGGWRFVQVLASLAAAVGITLLVPIVMLLAGLAIALPVRGIIETIGWLMARIVS